MEIEGEVVKVEGEMQHKHNVLLCGSITPKVSSKISETFRPI